MGDECFCLECSKACDQQKWKNPHSCCLLECAAAFPEEPASPKTFCLFFFCLAFSWVATFCLWVSFARLHLYCNACRCWGLVRGSGSLLALTEKQENSISLYVRSLRGTGNSLLKTAHVTCPPSAQDMQVVFCSLR